jgi:hypothetical protein
MGYLDVLSNAFSRLGLSHLALAGLFLVSSSSLALLNAFFSYATDN